MVETVLGGVAQRDAVMVAVAIEEGHDARAVGEREAKRVLEKTLRRGDIVAVENDMSEANRPIANCTRAGVSDIAMHRLEDSTIRIADRYCCAACRVGGRPERRNDRSARADREFTDPAQSVKGARTKGHFADLGALALVEREYVVVGSSPLQVAGIGSFGDDGETPGLRVEVLGASEVGHGQRDAAQCRDQRRAHWRFPSRSR